MRNPRILTTSLCFSYPLKRGDVDDVYQEGLRDLWGGPTEGRRPWELPCSVTCNVCEPGNCWALLPTAGSHTTGRTIVPLFCSYCSASQPHSPAKRADLSSVISSVLPWSCIPSSLGCLVYFFIILVSLFSQHWNCWAGSTAQGKDHGLVLALSGGTSWQGGLSSPRAHGPVFPWDIYSHAAFADHFSEVLGPVKEQTQGPIQTVYGSIWMIPVSC